MRYGVICFLVVCHIILAAGATATRRQERLAGGNLIIDHRYPWVVSIKSIYGKNFTLNATLQYRLCTGSFIDIYGTVITAAHCFDDPKVISSETYRLQNVLVKWGAYHADETNKRGTLVDLSLIVRHPASYSVHRRVNKSDIDVALILLNTFVHNPINCSDPTVMPIELSNRAANSTPTNGMVAGFGRQPQTNENNVITGYIEGKLSELSFRYGGRGRRTRNNFTRYGERLQSSAMFYGYPNLTPGGKPYNPTTGVYYTGLCKGDSGGPYMENEDGKIRLRGTVVAGWDRNDTSPCSQDGKPDIFADINYYLLRNWTLKILAIRYNQTGVGLLGGIPRMCK